MFYFQNKLRMSLPDEDFVCFCGVDQKVRATYCVPERTRPKTGIFTRNIVAFRQRMVIENEHPFPINVKVIDHYPLTNDANVKVTLLEPNVPVTPTPGRDPKCNIALNKFHNIEWRFVLEPTSQHELNVRYAFSNKAERFTRFTK